MEESVHIHHAPHKSTHHRTLLFLVPSFAFALTLALLSRGRYLSSTAPVTHEVKAWPEETRTIKIKDTEIMAYVANTSAEQSQGLGGRAQLGENEGMLFPFKFINYSARFWMKDMLIPLDFIWIRDGKIVHIHENVPAQGDTPDDQLPLVIPSEPVDHVLEVNAGFVAKYGIQKGDSITL